jgi:hypothetical protein
MYIVCKSCRVLQVGWSVGGLGKICGWGDGCEIEQDINVCAYCHCLTHVLPEGLAERRDLFLMPALRLMVQRTY